MIFYFLLVLVGSVIAARLILGELRKEKRDYIPLSPQEARTMLPVSVDAPTFEPEPEVIVKADQSAEDSLRSRLVKVEQLLVEKNIELEKLQNLVDAERRHKAEFEKIKSLLQWQIFETRQMNKEVKRELDALMIQGKHFKDEAYRLRSELNYKEQVLAQNETKILELKNRLHKYLSVDSAKPDDSRLKDKIDPELDSFDQYDWRTKLNE